jgi:archaemetzincin
MIYISTINFTKNLVNMEELEETIENDFGLTVKHQKIDMAVEKFYDAKRGQYHSTSILKELLYGLPSDAVRAIGIFPFDLFIPILTFVFGEAQLNGKVAIVSTARLEQEFYGVPSNDLLLKRRLIKEVKHELGHTFGLLHCTRKSCVMSLATNIADVDHKGLLFCNSCGDVLKPKRGQEFKTDDPVDIKR